MGSMGLVYLPTFVVYFHGKCIWKYTSPMDPVEYNGPVFMGEPSGRVTYVAGCLPVETQIVF